MLGNTKFNKLPKVTSIFISNFYELSNTHFQSTTSKDILNIKFHLNFPTNNSRHFVNPEHRPDRNSQSATSKHILNTHNRSNTKNTLPIILATSILHFENRLHPRLHAPHPHLPSPLPLLSPPT
ncbi:hypothetical protein NA56DRAFT_344428 [Hyaloscypha hepaticicola]|uniref:Uncharacterized protein n=1 Tax=Hyaloscypha hepaticicola TaxID=2082293 RepID=A0A2J6QJI0_9HELO|nr:hypothetical protein NA56DRAFT_344428 [Hyaloscypha hepaticicola]